MGQEVGCAVRQMTYLNPHDIVPGGAIPSGFSGTDWPQRGKKTGYRKNSLRDKQTSLKAAISDHITDGIHLGIGGRLNRREPVAIVHEIIRQGVKDICLSVTSGAVCCELLAGAMILYPDYLSIRRIELARYGQEMIGKAPLLRYLRNNNRVMIREYGFSAMAARLKAGARGISFVPGPDDSNGDRAFGNRRDLIPACKPDVGIIHVSAADRYGNFRIFGEQGTCADIAGASACTISTTEDMIPDPNFRAAAPCPTADAIVHQPLGAAPGACYGCYDFDAERFSAFRNICDEFIRTGRRERLERYYDRHIFACDTFDEFLARPPVLH